MIIFYCPDILTRPVLPEEDSAHAVRVLRHSVGDHVTCIDGRGTFYHCVITDAHPKRCALAIERTEPERHWPYRVELAVAPTKNMDRMEWMLEKCVEMGLDALIPIRCRNSERKELKDERLRRIAIAAAKQSLKASLPDLQPMTSVETLVAQPFEGQKFIAHCYRDAPRRLLSRLVSGGTPVRILIGPEGDFSEAEVAAAIAAGYQPISLGDQRLRTETAALAAVHTVHVVNELSLPDCP